MSGGWAIRQSKGRCISALGGFVGNVVVFMAEHMVMDRGIPSPIADGTIFFRDNVPRFLVASNRFGPKISADRAVTIAERGT